MKKLVKKVAAYLGISYGLAMTLGILLTIILSPFLILFGGFYLFVFIIKSHDLKFTIKSFSLFWGISYGVSKLLVMILMVISSPLIIVASFLVMFFLAFKEALNEKELSKLEKEKRDSLRDNYNVALKMHHEMKGRDIT